MNSTREPSARSGAILLLVGALLGVVGMALHPTGGLSQDGDPTTELARAATSAWVHGIVIVSLVAQLAGALGLCRRLGSTPARADLGLAALVTGSGFAILAATTNGVAAPRLLGLILEAEGPARQRFSAVWHVLHELADVATIVFLVSAATSALLWGWALVGRHRTTGFVGLAAGALGLGAVAVGLVRPEVGPLLAFVVLWEAWILVLARWMWSSGKEA